MYSRISINHVDKMCIKNRFIESKIILKKNYLKISDIDDQKKHHKNHTYRKIYIEKNIEIFINEKKIGEPLVDPRGSKQTHRTTHRTNMRSTPI